MGYVVELEKPLANQDLSKCNACLYTLGSHGGLGKLVLRAQAEATSAEIGPDLFLSAGSKSDPPI